MPTMDEVAKAFGLCEWCGALHTKLCDGILSENPHTTCNRKICASHARQVGHVRLQTRFGCRGDSRDLCPDCVEKERKVF